MRIIGGFWLLINIPMLAAQGSWAASRWSGSLTLGPERFQIASSQGGTAVDQIPWAGRITFGYAWRENLTLRASSGFLTGTRIEKVSPTQGTESQVEARLWGYPAEIGLTFPLELQEGFRFMPGMSLGYFRLHYQEKQKIGGVAAASSLYRLSGFGAIISAGLETKVTERLRLFGDVRAGLPLMRESWTEGSDSTQTAYVQDVRPSWSGMEMGFRWTF